MGGAQPTFAGARISKETAKACLRATPCLPCETPNRRGTVPLRPRGQQPAEGIVGRLTECYTLRKRALALWPHLHAACCGGRKTRRRMDGRKSCPSCLHGAFRLASIAIGGVGADPPPRQPSQPASHLQHDQGHCPCGLWQPGAPGCRGCAGAGGGCRARGERAGAEAEDSGGGGGRCHGRGPAAAVWAQ